MNKGDFEPLGLHWNGSAWSVSSGLPTALGEGYSPNVNAFDKLDAVRLNSPTDVVLNSVGTTPGAAVVWAVGSSGAAGSFDPLALRNG